jgi:hypothetical protein
MHGLKEICKELKTNERTIVPILHDHGISTSRQVSDYLTSKELSTSRKFYLQEDYFENIDCDTKSYWLGFIFADGNVYAPKGKYGKFKGIRIEIALKGDDAYHLANFSQCINSNYPIKFRKVKCGEKYFESCRISNGSVKMGKDLMNLGCVPNKSLILEYPLNLDDQFFGAFLRGYMDGDGCISAYIENKIVRYSSITLMGTLSFLTTIKNKLLNYGIHTNEIYKSKSNAYIIRFSNYDYSKLYDLMYKNAEYILGRKMDKFREILLFSDKECNISPAAKMAYLFL